MKLVPVLDLKDGSAVHARRGNRTQYQPVESRIAPGASDPVALGLALREIGFHSVYIADLDAIAGTGNHLPVIRQLARATGLRVWLDAGVRVGRDAIGLLAEPGVWAVVCGSETLAGIAELRPVLSAVGPDRLLFSLDLRGGQVLTTAPTLATARPGEILRQAFQAGITQGLAIELGAVGAESGPDLSLARTAAAELPGFSLYIGGGVRGEADLMALQAAWAAGALIATCLHTGALTPEEVRRWL